MLEILILIALCRNIAAKARAKGRSGGGFGCLLVALWFGCEFAGMIVGAVFSMAMNGGDEPELALVAVCGLAGGAVGALIAFGIVSAIGPVPQRGEYDDYDDRDRDDDRPDDRPRRRNPEDDRWERGS
jgi:hypothetical protein